MIINVRHKSNNLDNNECECRVLVLVLVVLNQHLTFIVHVGFYHMYGLVVEIQKYPPDKPSFANSIILIKGPMDF